MLNLIAFFEKFLLYVHEGYWSQFSFLLSLPSFGIGVMLTQRWVEKGSWHSMNSRLDAIQVKTCTPISLKPNFTIHQPKYTINHSYIMNHNWRLLGTQPNSTTKIIACLSIAHTGYITAIIMYNPNITILNTHHLYHNNTIFLLFVASSCTLSLSQIWDKSFHHNPYPHHYNIRSPTMIKIFTQMNIGEKW